MDCYSLKTFALYKMYKINKTMFPSQVGAQYMLAAPSILTYKQFAKFPLAKGTLR